MTLLSTITRQGTRLPEEKLNILTFVTHERYEPNLCKTGHNFYSLTGSGTRSWNTKVAPVPDNYTIIPTDFNNLINPAIPWEAKIRKIRNIDFDCIIAQNVFGHAQIAKTIQNTIRVPLICIEHTDTMPSWSDEYIKSMLSLRGDINVFISEYSKERWMCEDGIVLEHGIDHDTFCLSDKPRKNHILSMCNDWINRDVPCGFSIWLRICANLPCKVVGDTPGLSKGLDSLEECVNELQTSRIFFNTSQFSPIPMSLLEAMSCGCAVVSTATCMIPEIIKHGENGFISNDESKLREYLTLLLNDEALAKKIGENARKTIISRFGMDKFTDSWNNVLRKIDGIRK